MENKIIELLQTLHSYNFGEPDSLILQLRTCIFAENLSPAQIAFASAKLLNSETSLIEFLKKSSQDKDNVMVGMRKRIFELIKEYIQNRFQEVVEYVSIIKEQCMKSFVSEVGAKVKAASLEPLIKILQVYDSHEIHDILNPPKMITIYLLNPYALLCLFYFCFTLLDEIKLRKPSATVKGLIWELIGILLQKYSNELDDFKLEAQDVMYNTLISQLKSKKPELRTIVGILRSLKYALHDVQLSNQQMKQIYLCIVTAMTPLEDVSNYSVIKAAMKLLMNKSMLFKSYILENAISLSDLIFKICGLDNFEVQEKANQLLEEITKRFAEGLTDDQVLHKEIFKYLIQKFNQIIDNSHIYKSSLVGTVIRSIGIFSKAIIAFMGNQSLTVTFTRLIQLSQNRIMSEFEEAWGKSKVEIQDFRIILSKQKQLTSFLSSYSYILQNLIHIPQIGLDHLFEIVMLGVKNHRKLYEKYKPLFYDSLANLIFSISFHKKIFHPFIQRLIKDAIMETLKIPDDVIFGGESPAKSLEIAIEFWNGWFQHQRNLNEDVCKMVYEDFMEYFNESLERLDLSYETKADLDSGSIQTYVANNETDLQFFIRLINFSELIFPKLELEWIESWLPILFETVSSKIYSFPRVSKLYSFMTAIMEMASELDYFSETKIKNDSTISNTFHSVFLLLKHLLIVQEEYQDELLGICLELLLSTPTSFIHGSGGNHLHLFVPVVQKSLDIGLINTYLGMKAISSLERWFKFIDLNLLKEVIQHILPSITKYLQKKKNEKTTTFENAAEMVLRSQVKQIDQYTLQTKAVQLLGNLGGYVHYMIPTNHHEKKQNLAIDSKKKLNFPIPLMNKKIEIFLDSLLPKVVQLTKSNVNKETRMVAIELFHSLVIFIIGKTNEQQERMTFEKIYESILMDVFLLATDIEEIPRKLFQPLSLQLIRWFASNKSYEKPEVGVLLDTLLEGASDKSNASLRELCCNGISEFTKWNLKNMTKQEIKDNPVLIKSLIRRIQSNSVHPHPFKKISSLSCFDKLLLILREEQSMIDTFFLQICKSSIDCLKLLHYNNVSEEDNLKYASLFGRIHKILEKLGFLFKEENPKRGTIQCLNQLIHALFQNLSIPETVCRIESQKLWEKAIVTVKDFKGTSSSLVKRWINSSIPQNEQFLKYDPINFNQIYHQVQQTKDQQNNIQIVVRSFENLVAQTQAVGWVIEKNYLSIKELDIISKTAMKTLRSNILSFISTIDVELAELLKSKDRRDLFIRQKVNVYVEIMKYMHLLEEPHFSNLIDAIQAENRNFLELLLIGLIVPSEYKLGRVSSASLESQNKMNAIIELLLPKAFQNLIGAKKKNSMKIIFDKISDLLQNYEIMNFSLHTAESIGNMESEVLTQMCLGYLKLFRVITEQFDSKKPIDKAQSEYLVFGENVFLQELIKDWVNKLSGFVEVLVESPNPRFQHNAKILLKCILHLGVPNKILLKWLTENYIFFKQNSEILIDYIAKTWNHELNDPISSPSSFLLTNTPTVLALLPLFIPIIKKLIASKVPRFIYKFYEILPVSWRTGLLAIEVPMSDDKFKNKKKGKQKKEEEKKEDRLDEDGIIHELQIYTCLLEYSQHYHLDDVQSKKYHPFLCFCMDKANFYLNPKNGFSITVGNTALIFTTPFFTLETYTKRSMCSFIEDSLSDLEGKYFPLKTIDLDKKSEHGMNFEMIFNSFLKIFVTSSSFSSLEWIMPIIREEHSAYEHKIKAAIKVYIQKVSKKDLPTFCNHFSNQLQVFNDLQTDDNIKDNLRWAIARRIMIPLLKKSKIKYLEELMKIHAKNFQQILNTKEKDFDNQPQELYFLLLQKSYILKFFEVFYQRIDCEVIKSDIHKNIYGTKTQGNELTKMLILFCHNSKRQPISNFNKIEEWLKSNDHLEKAKHLKILFGSSAYCCLCSVIMKTQTKEGPYSQFLFVTHRDKGDELWKNIADLEIQYSFPVETNFNIKSIQINDNDESKENYQEEDVLMEKYFAQSFFSQDAKIATNLIFETQPQELTGNQFIGNIDNILGMKPDQQDKLDKGQEDIELDPINSLAIMKSLIPLINSMKKQFIDSWKSNYPMMPSFMQALNFEVQRPNVPLNLKILIFKIIVNHSDIFVEYMKDWIIPILEFLGDKNTGGKGFHYFFRDLCTFILRSDFVPEGSISNYKLCSNVINNIVKISADKNKHIFGTNIRILGGLIQKWEKLIYLNPKVLSSMICRNDKLSDAYLWRINAIQIVGYACKYDIPFCESIETFMGLRDNERKFVLTNDDQLFKGLLENLFSKRKNIIYASAELLGSILSKTNSNVLIETVTKLLQYKIWESSASNFIEIINKISIHFPQILKNAGLFLKLQELIVKINGKIRATIFDALKNFVEVCRKDNLLNEIEEIALNLLGSINSIIIDQNEIHQTSLVNLLMSLSNVKTKSIMKLMEKFLGHTSFGLSENLSDPMGRSLYFRLGNSLYDKYEELRKLSIRSVMKGFYDSLPSIRNQLFESWNHVDRLSENPTERMALILELLYNKDDEEHFLQICMNLILMLSKKAGDYERKLYNEPLSNCNFNKLNLHQNNFFFNRSQPLTPIFSFQFSQFVQEKKDDSQGQEGLPSIEEFLDEDDDSQPMNRKQKKVIKKKIQQKEERKGNLSQSEQRKKEQIGGQNQIKASVQVENLLFTPSQSSLLISEESIFPFGKATQLSSSFYGIQNNPQQRQQKNINQGFAIGQPPKEEEGEPNDEDLFQIPEGSQGTKKRRYISKFLSERSFGTKPIEIKESGNVRYRSMGSMSSQFQDAKFIRKKQKDLWALRQKQQRSKQISIYRQYRIGELPDIEIQYKDLILPLAVLCRLDNTIASEMFINLFIELYKNEGQDRLKQLLIKHLEEILSETSNCSYQLIYSLQSIIIQLIRTSQFNFDKDLIRKTAKTSVSYHTGILALEESIEHIPNERIFVQDRKKRKVDKNQILAKNEEYAGILDGTVSEHNKKTWINLIDLYKALGCDDVVNGIWESITSSIESSYQILIKNAISCKNNGRYSIANQQFVQILEDEDLQDQLTHELSEEIKRERLECMAYLSEWEKLAEEMKYLTNYDKKDQIVPINISNLEEINYLLRSRIRDEDHWQILKQNLKEWENQPISAGILEKHFNYILSLMSIISKDLDRGIFFINQELQNFILSWTNLENMPQYSQHHLLQKIQKIHEFNEFIDIMKKENVMGKNEIFKLISQLMERWKNRFPSIIYDGMETWDDILQSRILFLDILKNKFTGLKKHLDEQPPTKNIIGKLFTIVANGAYKKKMYESSDKYLKMALKFRDKKDIDADITIPIIKLKTKQNKIDSIESDFNTRVLKINKIIEVVNAERRKQANVSPKAEINFLYFLAKLYSDKSQIILQKGLDIDSNEYNEQALQPFTQSLISANKSIKEAYEQVEEYANDGTDKFLKERIIYKYARMSDQLLRNHESDQTAFFEDAFKEAKLSSRILAKIVIKNTLISLNNGNLKARDLIPRLLDILAKYYKDVKEIFMKESKSTPAWLFLKWIHELVGFVNQKESDALKSKLKEIMKLYPEPLFYAFNVHLSNEDVDLINPRRNEDSAPTAVYEMLSEHYKEFGKMKAWFESLDGLVYPEQRMKYWIDVIKEVFPSDAKKDFERIKKFVELMFSDLFSLDKPFVGKRIGSYNRKFLQNWEKVLKKEFGNKGEKILKISHANFIKSLNPILTQVTENISKIGDGYQKLSTFSEWLDDYNSNDYSDKFQTLEIPGQYDTDLEPVLETHIKISSLNKRVLILNSIRKPKRIEINGSNEKSYYYLVKGGEDLRLDQRIQQLFGVANKIFANNPSCFSRNLNIKQFAILPITNRLGILQWVQNSLPMKNLIQDEYAKLGVPDIRKCPALIDRVKWLQKIGGAKNSIPQQHLALLQIKEEQKIVEPFKEHVGLTPYNLLKKGIESLSSSPEGFIQIRERFIKSFATLNIVSYILGVGDRHLENYLIQTKNGQVLGIDFGIAFGNGLHLGIPELIPFRLTTQIKGVLAPLGVNGLYRYSSLHTLSALKAKQELLLDAAEIFVKDPLFDWVKTAKAKANSSLSMSGAGASGSGSVGIQSQQEIEQLMWYPKKKLQIMQSKLQGRNPAQIMIQELSDSIHIKKPYITNLKNILKGNPESLRNKLWNETILDNNQQIGCLIEMAQDPNILGRTWIGWAPHL